MSLVHPLYRLLLAHPEMLAAHGAAYGELLRDELRAAGASWQRRLRLQLLAGGALLVGAVLVGQVLLMWTLWPEGPGAVQLLVPVLPLLVAVAASWAASRSPAGKAALPWSRLQQQMSADLALMRESAATE